jgi:hypothetical protein
MWPLLGVPNANVVDGVGNGNAVAALLLVVDAFGTVWVTFCSAPESNQLKT